MPQGAYTVFKEHSILDNIYLFWEGSRVAKKFGQQIVVVLIDLEKGYNGIELNFLEGVLK
jgi:imidazole glycerol phosphate synthase subunit HisF